MEEETVWGQKAAVYISKTDTRANKTLRESWKMCLSRNMKIYW